MKKKKLNQELLLKILIVLLMINYMIVTIILKDRAVFKYLRDIILMLLVFITCFNGNVRRIPRFWACALFALMVLFAIPRATSAGAALSATRRYLFPIVVFFVAYNFGNRKNIQGLIKFILPFFALLSVWGMFQAYVLKDDFLKMLGYPQTFLPAYGRMMLNQAFYFGNLGIQRVSSTLSSPNILALILGSVILFLLLNTTYLKPVKYGKLYMGVVMLAYLLTVSRSNFLALIIVVIIVAFPYIPYKRYFFLAGVVLVSVIAVIGVVQGSDGIIYKLVVWVQNSLNFTESSAAGRSSRWSEAFQEVVKNPMGIGPGHAGSIASNAGKQGDYFDCENSYLCMALDVGWLGCIAYFGFLAYLALYSKKQVEIFKRIYKNDELATLNMSIFCMLMYLAIVMFFSNHVQDMEAMTFYYLFAGSVFGWTRRELQQKRTN